MIADAGRVHIKNPSHDLAKQRFLLEPSPAVPG